MLKVEFDLTPNEESYISSTSVLRMINNVENLVLDIEPNDEAEDENRNIALGDIGECKYLVDRVWRAIANAIYLRNASSQKREEGS